jgi:hypothetical protein
MDLYTLQEFVGVLAVVAVLTATTVVIGIAFILLQEATLRAGRIARAGVLAFKTLSLKKDTLSKEPRVNTLAVKT